MRFQRLSSGILIAASAACCGVSFAQPPTTGARQASDLLRLVSAPAANRLPAGWRMRAVRGSQPPSTEIIDSAGVRFLRIGGTKRAAWFVNELAMPQRAGEGTLHWTWRVPLAPAEASAHSAATDDAALRVFVVFERHSRFARTPRALFYTVSDGEPAAVPGSRGPMVTINAGMPAQSRGWVNRSADPGRDYRRIWGSDAPRIIAVGVMQDTDQTMNAAIGDIQILEWRNVDASIP